MTRSNGLKGQKAGSPGQRPGWSDGGKYALKGQKHWYSDNAFALSGRWLHSPITQGVALGYLLSGLSGRYNTKDSLFAKLELFAYPLKEIPVQ